MAPVPKLDIPEYPKKDERTIMEKAREGNAKLVAAGAAAGTLVLGPLGTVVGGAAAYSGVVDEDDLDRILHAVFRLTTGDWTKVESLARRWQNRIQWPTNIAKDLREANIVVNRYWNGPAYDAFNGYLGDTLIKIEATSDRIAAMSDHLAGLLTHVGSAMGDMIRAMSSCAQTLLSTANPVKWLSVIGDLIGVLTDLMAGFTQRFTELRGEAVKVGNNAALLRQINELPGGTVHDGSTSGDGLSGWRVEQA